MRKLLDGGAEVDTPDKEGLTPLHFASALGREEACRLLLQHNAKIDSPIPDSCAQPIHLGAGNGKLQVVRLLIEKGAKVDAYDSDRGTPLQRAAKQGQLSAVEWLVSKKTEINAKNKNGWSARMLAVQEGHKEVAAFLLRHGATKSPSDDE